MTWLKWAAVMVFMILGAGLIVAALLSEGQTVGRFKKSFCYVLGVLLVIISIWLR